MDFHKGMAIHCPEYEDAVNLLEKLDSCGYKWSSGDPIIYYIDFYSYGENTYFFINDDGVMYGDDTYLSGYEVYEFLNGTLKRTEITQMNNGDYEKLIELTKKIAYNLFDKYKNYEDDISTRDLVKGEIHSAVGVGIYEAEIEYFI